MPRARRPLTAPFVSLAAAVSLVVACGGPLDGKRVAAEVDACRSAIAESILLAEQAEDHHLVGAMLVTQRKALAGRLTEALEALDRGASPPNADLAAAAGHVGHALVPTVEQLDPADTAARTRLRAGLAQLDELRGRVEGAR